MDIVPPAQTFEEFSKWANTQVIKGDIWEFARTAFLAGQRSKGEK